MATETTVATERSVDARTLAEMVLGAAERHDGTALKFKRDDEWAEMSYEELGDRARAYGRGLIALGIEPGDRVAILGETAPEWTLADLAALCAGAVVVPV
jgi:long-chain acyl-CoA synthetase